MLKLGSTVGLAWSCRRVRAALALSALALSALGYAACLPGVSYDKVEEQSCAPTLGSCDEGIYIQLGGAGNVQVTDMARLGNLSTTVLVGRFSGSFSIGGQTLSAADGTDGFLLAIDGAGNYLSHLVLPEVDETSELRVAVEPNSNDVVVGGNYSQGSVGNCTAARGLFVRRLRYDASNGYVSQFPGIEVACIESDDTTAIEVRDIGVYPNTPYVTLVGSFDGVLGGVNSQGVDGFAQAVAPDGVAEPIFVVGGSGDASVAAGMPSFDNNEWVLFGDFSGDLSVEVVNLPPQTASAGAGRQLFVLSFDGYELSPNLFLTTSNSEGGLHRALGLAYSPFAVTDRAVLLAQLDGSIVMDNQLLNGSGGSAVLAMAFQVPIDSNVNNIQVPFDVIDHYLLRADSIVPTQVTGNADQFVLGGHARGDIAVERGGAAIGQIQAAGCQQDAFIVSLQQNVVSRPQRCGDGQQQLVAMSPRQGGGAIAITVPTGSSLDAGQGTVSVDSGIDTFVLLQ